MQGFFIGEKRPAGGRPWHFKNRTPQRVFANILREVFPQLKARMPTPTTSLSVALSALVFMLVFYLQALLLGMAPVGSGLGWLSLPCGASLLIVVMWGSWGALGIVLGRFIATQDFTSDLNVVNLGVCILCGLAPWLGSLFTQRVLPLGGNPAQLTPRGLLTMGLVCAALTALGLQVWHQLCGQAGPFFENLAPRLLGHMGGTLVVLYAIKACFALSDRLHKVKINRALITK